MDVHNTEKVCQIVERKMQIESLSEETRIVIEKKEMMSKKIMEAERDIVTFEEERDQLKIQINKIVHIEMNMKRK